MNKQVPKLRSVQKYHPEYPLNSFPSGFALKLGKEIVYLLATRSEPRLEGSDWEEIFARCIGAEWAPSNVGLDDVVLKQMAWGAKTVKNAKPFDARHVRLICGRNSPDYSYGVKNVRDMDISELGEKIMQILENGSVTSPRGFTAAAVAAEIKYTGRTDLAIVYSKVPTVHTGVTFLNSAVNPIISSELAPDPLSSAYSPIQVLLFAASLIWVAGVAVLLIYSAASYIRVRLRVRESVWQSENIYICDRIDTPFILGIIKPKIYFII